VSSIFVLAPPRSCSTVAVAMLAQHPQIYGFPELVLFTAPTVGELLAQHPQNMDMPADWIDRRLSGLYRAVAEVHRGGQDAGDLDWAHGWLEARAHWPTPRLMRHLADQVHPCAALEKSAETVTRASALDICLGAFPDARFIHLTRHPAATVSSMQDYWADLFATADSAALSRFCALTWCRTHIRISRRLAGIARENWIRVKAEDLLNDPRRTLDRIVRWLGFDHDEAVLDRMRYPERWQFGGFGPTGRLYGGDWKFLSWPSLHRIPQPGPAGADPAWGFDKLQRARFRALAEHLGYA
jgi:hypothetical protein